MVENESYHIDTNFLNKASRILIHLTNSFDM